MYPALLITLIATVHLSAQGLKDDESRLYYPINEGTKLVYAVTLGEEHYDLRQTVTKAERAKDSFRVTVETKGDTLSSTFVVEVSKRRVSLVADKGKDLPAPEVMLVLPAKVGHTWTRKSFGNRDAENTIGKEEEITVPAGKFKAIPVTYKVANRDGENTTATTWYAPDVGVVKNVLKFGDTERTKVLKSITVPNEHAKPVAKP